MDPDLLHCSVCLSGYNSSNKRPFDLGCGHSFCEQCIKSSPRSFRSCPECRTRASNPHANIALLRLLDSLGANGNTAPSAGPATGSTHGQPQQQQQPSTQQPRQRQHQQPMPAFGPAGVFRPQGNGQEPLGTLGTILNQVSAAIPSSVSHGSSGGSGGQNPVVALPGSLATHKANIAQLRTSMWVWLTPLLGALYILSPLDIIPDFIPLVGWLDDAVVLYYIVCSLYQLFQDRAAAPAPPHRS